MIIEIDEQAEKMLAEIERTNGWREAGSALMAAYDMGMGIGAEVSIRQIFAKEKAREFLKLVKVVK